MPAECTTLRALPANKWVLIQTATVTSRHQRLAALASLKNSRPNYHSAAISESPQTPKSFVSFTMALKLLISRNHPSLILQLQLHLSCRKAVIQKKISKAGSLLNIQTLPEEMPAVSPAPRLTKQFLFLRASRRLHLTLISIGNLSTLFLPSPWIMEPNGQINIPNLLPMGICLSTEKALKLNLEEELSFKWTILELLVPTEILPTM